ncbi:GNAT family N-acetyltransferase [Hyphomonas sp.]|uniref:GNAT family N-acetyltransferase n=1 Tax=Hyphomonas sp. TaxID=87 RepID=UPI0039193D0E
MSMRRLPQGYQICGAAEEEIPDLIAIDLAAGQLFAGTGLLPEEALSDHVPADILRDAIALGHIHTVRDAKGRLAGFTLTSVRRTTLYLDQISVHPDHGRKGLGAALLERVAGEAKDRGLKTVMLSTFRDLPWNAPFYRRHGFRIVPPRKYETWMLQIEAAQAKQGLDVSKRCFMVRRLGIF